jgi:DNA-binding LacI/PurR family transcriptional regulator
LPNIRDIAALAGVTRESVSRVIAELKRLNLLARSGVNQVEYDNEGLKQLLEGMDG